MMQNDSPEKGLRTVWLNQPLETTKMTLKLMEYRSRELRAKTRRKLMGSVAGPLTAAMLYGYSMREFAGLRPVLQASFAFALTWSLAGLYFLNRGMWSEAMPGDAGLSTGLEFCRREIERQRDLVHRFLLWSFGPITVAIGTFVVVLGLVGGIFPKGLPFLLVVVVWMVLWFVMRLREQRGLQREIEELNDIEKENRRR
jgi:hypothetical protein